MNITQLKTIQQNFLQELKDASYGKKTSLPFIIHNHSSKPIVQDREVFQVMVIGGSVFKKAICKKSKNKIEIIKKETEKPLNFRTEKDFLEFIQHLFKTPHKKNTPLKKGAGFICHELSNNVKVLALNFAYPLKPVFENEKLDGILLGVLKEGSMHDLIGKKVGEEIETYIWKKRKRKIKVSLANDTVCLLLSGLTRYSFDKIAGGIVGTGLNFGFFLRKDRLVNLESEHFDKFSQTQEGKIVDKQSNKPGTAIFEKETAGAYLYKHFNIIVQERKIDFPAISSTEELNRISLDQNYSSTDRVTSQIARDLLRRSAQLVACQVAGILHFVQNDKENKSMVFNMEGSLFWKGNNYKETVMETVKLLVPKHKIEFVEIENSAILGAAKLVA